MHYAAGAFIAGEAEARTIASKILGDHARPDRIEAVIGMLREKTKIEESRLNPRAYDLINVSNGMLDWRSEKLQPHSPDFLSTCQINAVYEPEVCDSVLDGFFDAVLPKDDQRVIEEMMGYLLIPSTRFQKCFMLAGEGANGKSTFMDALAHMIGERNVSHVSLHDLASNRFMTAELQGKLVNIYPEVHHMDVDQTDVFKAIVTGNPIKAERKHGHPFRLIPHARLIFSANEMPRANDTTYGYFRRWMIVPFAKKFIGKGDDKNMLTKLKSSTARSAMLNRAIEGLGRLMEQGDFSRSRSVEAAVDQYRRQSDSIYDYIQDRIGVDQKSEIPKDGVFKDYELWCQKIGVKMPFSRRVFSQRFPKLIVVREARTTMAGGYKPWVWRGIRFKPREDGGLSSGRKHGPLGPHKGHFISNG